MREKLKRIKTLRWELQRDIDRSGKASWFPEDQEILDWLISEVESLQETLDWINEGRKK